MTEVMREPITEASAWIGAEMQNREDLYYRLSEEEIEELDAAIRGVRARGLSMGDVGREDFPLPSFGRTLESMGRGLEHGRGFVLIRGFPRERYSEEDCGLVHWGIGTHLGKAKSQDSRGSHLGHIRDAGKPIEIKNSVRGYQTNVALPYHTDGADLVGLFCLQTAMAGGESRLVSAVAVHNRFLERRPDLIGQLYEHFYFDRRGENTGSQKPYYHQPIYVWHEDRVSCRYVRGYILAAQQYPDVPRFTDTQIEALDTFDEIINEPDMALIFDLEPGDIQYANNFMILHSRTEFEDFPEPERRRHLLRIWLAAPGGRALPAEFGRTGITQNIT